MSPALSMGSLKRAIALLAVVAIVVGAGVIVGQAPALFGADVAQDPHASITFTDQESNGSAVLVDSVSLSDGGFVVVTDERGTVVGVSEKLGSDEYDNVTVERIEDQDRELHGRLTATVYHDHTDDDEYSPDPDEGTGDRPYIVDGYPVSETATVMNVDRDPTATDSFTVQSIEGPSTGYTTETVTILAEIENPTDEERRQDTELRIGGALYEQQVFTLDAGETREMSFDVDLSDIGEGNVTYGVYTETDGMQGEITIEYDGPPHLSIQEANTTEMVVDVGVPDGGFVAVEDVDGQLLGTSTELEPGVYEGVRIEFDDLDASGNLTAIAYEGDPDEPDEATAYEWEGDPIADATDVRADLE
ncbi:DUF7282 domain-containing protein [Halovivax gelatinilyticus]|uniref:DUF7282 domain-containing protein n=1 Tax=Halovivax gelatinilyticus TaxID=2961597 RepID=UPI0020CA4FF8|nr:hypothetical protein [Halovivax gelatinilyticus]